ncbi:MAG: hypothetical protein US76_01165 [Parcubacteria group bacterium GW2011_GWA2_38_13b]|nr:MAG: hypothetical protein US76_01165 [Parcubacteria group bacterium GW2011_GWA2_38_13b]
MIETLLFLMPFPLLIGLIGFLLGKGKITIKEYAIQEVVIMLIVFLSCVIGRQFALRDTEIWSGRVLNKQKVSVSCEHSYRVVVGHDSNGNPIYATRYYHSNDWDWEVETSDKGIIDIRRVDGRGSKEPPRWTQVYVGEPTASAHNYVNYIKASPWTILKRHGQLQEFQKWGLIPVYPNEIYDYYRINRFLNAKTSILMEEAREWNKELMKINSELGRKKEVNIIIIAVNTKNSSYIHTLEEAWFGGKKNDLVVILGVPSYPRIDWVRIMSWTKMEMLKVVLRDKVADIGDMTRRQDILDVIKKEIDEKFVRTPMADFAYLKATLRPSFRAMLILSFLSIGVSAGLSIFFWKNETV